MNRTVFLVLPDLALGGAQRVGVRLAERWTASGDHVRIVTLGRPEGDHFDLPSGVSRTSIAPVTERGGVAGVVRKNVHRARSLRRLVRADRPDVIVAFVDATNVFTLLATRGLRVPVIVSERVDPREHWISLPHRVIRRLLYRRAAAVVVQTDRVVEWATTVTDGQRVHVIPNPVPLPVTAARPAEPPTIVAAGRLVHQKGFDVLIEALGGIDRALLGPWQLEICGEGEARRELEAQIDNLGLRDRVHLAGSVRDLDAHLERASIFAFPSRFEGFPNALTEAMAWGLPVVASDCPTGPRELIDDGVSGRLVPVDDPKALAGALTALIESPAERARLGAAARRSLGSFDPDKIAAVWSDLFEEVISRVRHRRRR